jgi:hydroxymethylpyrimidine pyrophosphatase-like HAD family hydrolase
MIQPLLICTDLDRTLIPNGEQPESPQARPLFRQLVSHSQIILAYVTGRDKMLVQEAIAEYE